MDRDDHENATERSLARLGAATGELTPDDRLTDAVMARVAEVQPAGDPLARIAQATHSLDVGDAFTRAVMARVASSHAAQPAPPAWLDGVVRSGPVAIGLAVVAAAASFFLFTTNQSDLDVTVASAVQTVEVDE